MNLGIVLILAAAIQATPSPGASPAPTSAPAPSDTCADEHGRTSVLSAINRPTIGFSACAVKRGDVLVELGLQQNSGDVSQTQIGQGIIRFGVAPNVEGDFIGPAYLKQSNPQVPSGFADSGLGMKWEFSHDAQSAAAVDLIVTAPTGAAAFTAGVPTQLLNLNYGTGFGNFGIGITAGFLHSSQYSAFQPAVVLTNQFNDRTQWYAETFAQTHYASSGSALMGLDGGLQYMLTPDLEFDIEAGRTISDTARIHYVGAGIGIRL